MSSNPLVVTIFGGNQANTGVFSIALPILETFGFSAKVRRSLGTRRILGAFFDMLQNRKALSLYKAGQKRRSDGLLAATERAGLLAH